MYASSILVVSCAKKSPETALSFFFVPHCFRTVHSAAALLYVYSIGHLSGIQYQYALVLPAPLITDPEDVRALTIEALRSNLVVHAQCNPGGVSTGGSEMEMVQRLEYILRCRESDLLVLDVLGWGGDLEEELALKEGMEASAQQKNMGVVSVV